MPHTFRAVIISLQTVLILSFSLINTNTYAKIEINKYYIRYDVKSTGHQIFDAQLTMIPAPEEFRAENFSMSQFSSVLAAEPVGESRKALELRAKEDALKMILKTRGLKSVTSRDTDTVVSYEGVVRVPMGLWLSEYDDTVRGYPFTARVHFSPLAFPDQWGYLGVKRRVKDTIHSFFELFR